MSDNTYNGHTNYETWATHMWIDNDQSSQYMAAELVKDHGRDLYSVESALRSFLATELMPADWADSAHLGTDLLGAALDDIDYRAVAQSLIDDVNESEPICNVADCENEMSYGDVSCFEGDCLSAVERDISDMFDIGEMHGLEWVMDGDITPGLLMSIAVKALRNSDDDDRLDYNMGIISAIHDVAR